MRNRIIDPDDEDNEEEVVTRRQRPRSRQSRTSQSSQGSGATTSHGRRRQIETIEEEDENETTLRPSRGRQIQRQNGEEMSMLQSQGNKSDSISEAVLATFALSSKGPIKEGDLKPLWFT
uniref:Uncharacterized protein n=1 Tax=Panagrolaimus superbus TaxID=310955 RepID=A0A914Y3Y9_9BILA